LQAGFEDSIEIEPKTEKNYSPLQYFFDVNFIPVSKGILFFKKTVTSIPSSIAITAPPIMGNSFPKIHDGIAIKRHNPIPRAFFFMKFI
jgi:hypothetical protein